MVTFFQRLRGPLYRVHRVAIYGLGLAWIGIVLFGSIGLKIDLRNALFFDLKRDASMMFAAPAELVKEGFRQDSKRAIEEAIQQYLPLTEVAQIKQFRKIPNDVERAQAITKHISTPLEHGCLDRYSLFQKLPMFIIGWGCCSDYTQMFSFYAGAAEISTRSIDNRRHQVSEFWSEDLRKWIFIDPLQALMATDERGNYLSYLELRDRILSGSPVKYVWLKPDDRHLHTGGSANTLMPIFSTPDAMRDIYVHFGSNVVETSNLEQHFQFLPAGGQKLISILSRVQPKIIWLAPDISPGALVRFYAMKYLLVLSLIYPLMGIGLEIWTLMMSRLRRQAVAIS